jgi:lysyl-tRNA synthetase class 1
VDWADELAARVDGPQVVNDSKTPSGTVHVGSLRGPVILDVITRALRTRGLETTLLYGVDDLDPMDAQALLSPDAIEREMGRPLAHVPDPAGDCHASYARHFAALFIDTFAGLGIRPDRYYWMSDIYPTGQLDPYIRLALDRAGVVRDIYRRVANVQHPDHWLPLGAVCPTCGKVGTTIASDWDGETVAVACRADLVTWATGCGWTGRLSPFGGAAKLPWNLEWAAQWSLFGVTIEPCGKDLSTAGGSRDRSDAIAREVFEREPPLNFPYEFLNIGGRKMSTSKGRGAAAHTIASVLPPEQLRFLFVRHRPESAIEFDPEGTDAIPRLFDEFDRLAAATAGREVKGELPSGYDSIFRYSLLDAGADLISQAIAFRPAFAHLALLAQVPGVDVAARVEAEKGSPLVDTEREELDRRLASVRAWLDAYAPDRARIEIRRGALPDEATRLSAEQRACLRALAEEADRASPASGEAWQEVIFRVAERLGLEPRAAFGALYLAFLGRPNGPRAGWLLASLEPEFVRSRLAAAAGGSAAGGADPPAGGPPGSGDELPGGARGTDPSAVDGREIESGNTEVPR